MTGEDGEMRTDGRGQVSSTFKGRVVLSATVLVSHLLGRALTLRVITPFELLLLSPSHLALTFDPPPPTKCYIVFVQVF